MIEKITTHAQLNTNVWQKVIYNKKSKNISNIKTLNNAVVVNGLHANKINSIKQNTIAAACTANDTKSKVVTSKSNISSTLPPTKDHTNQKQIKIESTKKLNLNKSLISSTSQAQIVGNSHRQRNLIRQIKRAHRHLLTSGGNDNNNGKKHQTAVLATLKSEKTKSSVVNCQNTNSWYSAKLLTQQQRLQQQKKKLKQQNFEKNAHSVGRNKSKQVQVQVQTTTKAGYKKQHKGKQRKQQAREIEIGTTVCSEDSVISSRWNSIEEQLDLLDKLLYYCDDDGYEQNQQYYCQYSSVDYDNFDGAYYDDSYKSDYSEMSQSDTQSTISSTSGAGSASSTPSPLVPTSLRRRGHQNHPRFQGTRRPTVPNVKEILEALYRGDSQGVLSNIRAQQQQQQQDGSETDTISTLDETGSQELELESCTKSNLSLPLTESITNSICSNSPTPTDDSSMLDEGVVTAQLPTTNSNTPILKSGRTKVKREKGEKGERGEKVDRSEKKKKSRRDKNKRASACPSDDTGKDYLTNPDEGIANDEDDQSAEWAKLRCTSEAAEIVAEREIRRNKRCADYPGLAFGRSIFSSDTMMKFNIIRNELHNIMKTQLKRAESEVAALNRRIQLLEEDLERSEERLGSATAKLSEASQAADESERIRKALENRTNMEDDRVAILEAQLAQAKLIAEEADKKYEEVARKLVLMEQDLERSEEKVELSESKIVELEEELRVVGNNLKSLEVSEEKATQKEETFESQIRVLDHQLKEAEARAEFAERSVQKLQKEVDRLEDDLIVEKERYCLIGDSLDLAFLDLIPGLEPFYTERNPKPPTPKLPTPTPEEIAAMEAAKAEAEAAAEAAAAGNGEAPTGEAAVEGVEGAAPVEAEVVPEAPKEPTPPPPPPPPFEYSIDLPPEGAEVPYVKNYEPPPPGSEEQAAPVEGAPPAEGAPSAEGAPPAEGATTTEAAPPADVAAAPTESAGPASDAAPAASTAEASTAAEAAPASESAPPAEAAPAVDNAPAGEGQTTEPAPAADAPPA
ncbi:uncharacterized protein LOC119678753 isoform X5 [Teleopsis dalmanni]|uniref:uncharacterized protein LOC119678753 isoform X5 n=1 Tax=Teleopsis dalmanni TaxID=139649 RepID=UPI0018CD9206|nr:uncharacterized protein LOC119678753 isoform X5 [Teleopsis dalmanni]